MEAKVLLATDMDGTVIPLDARRRRSLEIAQFRRRLRRQGHITLAYVTGRHLDLALEGVKRHRLPTPDFMVCDVGTAVYRRRPQGWRVDPTYRRKMKISMGGHAGQSAESALEGLSGITPQEPEKQAEFKRSFYVEPHVDRKKLIQGVKRRLRSRGLRANLIYSVDPKTQTALLDILPATVAKDFALHYLQSTLRIDPEGVVYAGDSGNDLLAFVSGFKAIVVGNTPENVKEVLRRLAEKKGLADRIYFARHAYVRGVMEGLEHFGVFEG